MNENYDEDLEYQRAAEERRKRRQQRRRHERNMKIAFFADSKDAVTREI